MRQRAQEEAQRATLGHLLNTYTTHLEQLGKSSAGDVRSILRKHVFNANAALVLRKAADISVDDFVGLIGAVVDKGKGRTAGKVRSFPRAAYALAIRSKIDPALPQAMRTFGIVVNPLASTAALSQFNGARKRHLNALELGRFLSVSMVFPLEQKRMHSRSVLVWAASGPPSCCVLARPMWTSRVAPSPL
jgi:hypothetical protein